MNTLGTAVLLESLMEHLVETLVVASSMSIYGEGLYRAADGSLYTEAISDTVAGRCLGGLRRLG